MNTLKSERMYRWSINTYNVYAFCWFHGKGKHFSAGTLASYKNEVSGFVRKDDFKEFFQLLQEYGTKTQFTNFKMVTSERYWKNYDKYNAYEIEHGMKQSKNFIK